MEERFRNYCHLLCYSVFLETALVSYFHTGCHSHVVYCGWWPRGSRVCLCFGKWGREKALENGGIVQLTAGQRHCPGPGIFGRITASLLVSPNKELHGFLLLFLSSGKFGGTQLIISLLRSSAQAMQVQTAGRPHPDSKNKNSQACRAHHAPRKLSGTSVG